MTSQPSSAGRPNIWGKIAAITVLVVVVGTLVTQRRSLLGFARNWDDLSDGSVEAKQLRNIPDVLTYLGLHKQDVSLVVFDVGDEANGLYLNADRLRPLASTVGLQVLLGYSAEVAAGKLQPEATLAVEDWERFWLPRTDAGSHEFAVRKLREEGAIKDGRVQLQDLVRAMVRFSDDAAADCLMDHLGRARVDALPAQLGMPAAEPAWPFSGQLLSWQNTQLTEPSAAVAQRYREQTRQAFADTAWQLLGSLEDPARSAAEHALLDADGLALSLREQAMLSALTSPRGTAQDYAALMARLGGGQLPGSDIAQKALGWLLANPELQSKFDSVATKAGTLPGVLADVYYARAKGRERIRVLAMFADKLPLAVWLQLMQKFLHQRFQLQLLHDDAFLEHVKQQLAQ